MSHTPGVVVTREEGPGGLLTRLLEGRGCRVLHWPVIRTAPPADPGPLEDALAGLDDFDWVVFTSRRAVAAVMERVGPEPVAGSGSAASPRVAAVGESTAGELRAAGWRVALVPVAQTGEALVAALRTRGLAAGDRVLFPASSIARDTVPDGLEEAGAVVVQVEAYRTEPAPLDRAGCRAALGRGDVDVVTFASPSSVENLVAALGRELAAEVRARVRAVAIGPTTGAAAAEAGFDVVEAAPHSLEGLAERVAALAVRERIEEA